MDRLGTGALEQGFDSWVTAERARMKAGESPVIPDRGPGVVIEGTVLKEGDDLSAYGGAFLVRVIGAHQDPNACNIAWFDAGTGSVSTGTMELQSIEDRAPLDPEETPWPIVIESPP